MARNYCTLFGKNYIFKALALYYSLVKHDRLFKLWILCMDEETYTVMKRINLKNVILIPISKFEDRGLLAIKNTRTFGEYCWTSTSSLPLYIFNNYQEVDEVTYLDADLFFFQSPSVVYQEFGTNSIFLIPHRHSYKYKYLEKVHGKYNVGLIIFRRKK